MKKVFGQTVRDLKRGVNKKVLKVPGVEQKVLDATSNEPWGPHGSLLAEIAQATKNYHEYQMIMAVLWKRINDTGKNWRHVYKALSVLEYLVANGSERVIEEIREHAYQISTLSDFQYIDSSGRDQGSNVRKKSQSLVVLVNDKERIQEAREKALVNREKFRNTTSTGGMHKPSTYGGRYEDDRYGRDDDQNGYRDDDRSSRASDSYSHDGDRYGRDSDERYGKDGYRDNDNMGRSRSYDDFQSGSRGRSSDGYRERDDDGRHSSRSSDARADDHSQDERRHERKFSENVGAPPSYEEAVSHARSPVHDERDGETPAAPAPKASSPTGSTSQSPGASGSETTAVPVNQESNGFDEFDPRGSFAANPPASSGEMDLLGSVSDSFSSNALDIMPATSAITTPEAEVLSESASGPTFVALSSASTILSQPIEDPFGDSPFKALPSADMSQQQAFPATTNFQPAAVSQSFEPVQPPPTQMQSTSGFDFEDTFESLTYAPPSVNNVQVPFTSSQFFSSEMSHANQDIDVLADILPPPGQTDQPQQFLALPAPTGSPPPSQSSFHENFTEQSGYGAPQGQFNAQSPPSQPSFPGSFSAQSGYGAPGSSQGPFNAQSMPSQPSVPEHFSTQSRYGAPGASRGPFNAQSMPSQPSVPENFSTQSGYGAPGASQGPFNAQNPPSQPSAPGNFSTQPGYGAPGASEGQFSGQSLPSQPSVTGNFSTQSGYGASGASEGQFSAQNLPSQPSVTGNFYTQAGYGAQVGAQGVFSAQSSSQTSYPGNFSTHSGYGAQVGAQGASNAQGLSAQPSYPGNFPAQSGYGASSVASHGAINASHGQPLQPSVPGNFHAQPGYGSTQATQGGFNAPSGNFHSQTGSTAPLSSQASLPPQTTVVSKPQPSKDKFATKSTVWADTLSRGLVNLNISGPKTNPLSDIGVDFDAINRKEKRENPAPQQVVTSTINMGKAMGSGSGIGRAGAGALAPPHNPMMGSGMGMGGGGMGGMGMGGGGMGGMGMGGGGMGGMGMGMGGGMGGMGMGGGMGGMGMGGGGGMGGMGGGGMGGMGMGGGMAGVGMGGYGGGMNQQPSGGGMQMGMNNMGMNNMGMGQGAQMRPQQGPNMQGGYNPMMGPGGYSSQNPYGGYR